MFYLPFNLIKCHALYGGFLEKIKFCCLVLSIWSIVSIIIIALILEKFSSNYYKVEECKLYRGRKASTGKIVEGSSPEGKSSRVTS